MDIITELKKDFNLDEKDFDINDFMLSQKLNARWDFNWFEYYKENIGEFKFYDFFNKLLKNNNNLEKIFNGNETYFLEKYGNIIKEGEYSNKEKYTITYNLADIIWEKFIQVDSFDEPVNIKSEYKIKLLPFISNIQRKFIWRLFENDDSLCFEMLKFMNYQLGKKELMVLYCREEMKFLEKIELTIDDELLQKALVYGRKNVIELLDKRGLLEKHSNPFALDKIDGIDFVEEIWYGWSWGNDECDRDIIGQNKLKRCFEICKKYFEIKEEYFDKWFEMSNQRDYYSPSYSMISSYFIKPDDLKSKTKIIGLVNKFGKHTIWNIIKKEGVCMLDILLEN